jgi:hypothetical protein
VFYTTVKSPGNRVKRGETANSSKASAARFRKLYRRRRVLSRSMATKIILDLEPQYADTVTARTLRAARVLATNVFVKSDVRAALKVVIRAGQTGHWETPDERAPECVWRACIVIWRLQRELSMDALDSEVAGTLKTRA